MRMNRILRLIFPCALSAALVFAASLHAQGTQVTASVSQTTGSHLLPAYNIAKEIRVQGIVEKLEVDASGLAGTHILIQTAQGVVDAHLGCGSAVTPKRLGLSTGEFVSLTGMMASYNGNSVLLARLLTTSSHIYILRNEKGIPIHSLVPRPSNAAGPALQEGF